MLMIAINRCILCAMVFGAFCLAGHLAQSVTWLSDSLLTGITVFGFSFVGSSAAIAKLWQILWS